MILTRAMTRAAETRHKRMSAKHKAISIGGASLTLLAIITAIVLLVGDRAVSRAVAMQSQLTSANPPSANIQKQLVQDLTRAVDKMNRTQLRELVDHVRAESRDRIRRNLQEYLETPESERAAVLDRHLLESQQWQKVYEALRTDAYTARRGRRGRGQNGQDRRSAANSERQQQASAANRGRDRSDRAERRGDRETDERRANERAELADYLEALRQRAEAQNIEFRGLGRGGRRRSR